MFYSNKNSHAGNPEEDKESNQPKLNGKQTEDPKTEDATRLSQAQPPPPQSHPLQPSPQPAAEPTEESSPFNLGDQKPKQLAMKKTTQPTPPTPPKPRTLKEALEQNHLPGLAMHQDGGAHRRLSAAFDAKATPFGDYDLAVINAVTERWYSLLDQQNFAQDRTGRVVVRFKLEYDGTVRDVEVLENNVGEVLSYVCQAAIENAAPFGKWPDEMRRAIGENFREVTFTFDYY
jgi:outer membrane biosynthesis protein TonB